MSDAQYAIDIAAQMSGGAQTVAQLDALGATLVAAGLSADALQDAVAMATNTLAAAKSVTTEANAALAAGAAEFRVLEQAALQAGKAQEKAAKLGVVPPETAAALDAANAALAEQTTTLRGLEAAAATAQANEARLAQTLANTKIAATQGAKALAAEAAAEKQLAADAAKAAAEVERQAKAADAAASSQAAATAKTVKKAEGFSPIVAKYNDLTEAMSSAEGRQVLMIGAVASATAAILALVVAVVAATVAIAAWAVGLADANRETALTEAAAAALHPELAALSGDFAAIGAELGASGADLRAWTKRLEEAHVGAADLPAALRAVAQADAALGKGEGLNAYLDQLKDAEGRASEASKVIDAKLGGIAADRMRGLAAQSAKLQKHIGALFGGLNIEPVLAGFEHLVALFDQNTEAGAAMKFLFESVFQPLINQAERAAQVVEGFALGFLIGLTKVYIALKPAIKAISEFFGFDDSGLVDLCELAAQAGEIAAYVFVGFAAAIGAIGAVIGLAIAQAVAFNAAVAAVVAAVAYAGAQIVAWFVGAFQSVVDYLTNINLADIGSNIIQGLINGVLNMGPNFLSAITGIADSAINAAKKALGIASPSTVFAAIGEYTGEGFVQGVDSMAGDAGAAMASMVEPPGAAPFATGNFAGGTPASSGAVAGGGASPGATAGGGSLLGSNNTFIFNGVKDAEQAESRFEEMLLRVLEGNASALQPAGG